MKRALAFIICLSMLVSIIPMSAFAVSKTDYSGEIVYPKFFESYESIKILEETVDIEELTAVLYNAFYKCEAGVDISAFNISNTAENINALTDLIFYEMPECFHINSYMMWSSSGKIIKIEPTYKFSAAEYHKMHTEMVAAKDKILQNINGNNRLTDVEKALLIHDRLALMCEYDYNNTDNRHNSYGALVNGTAVCQGYATAYNYLLREVGIRSYICSSEQLNHAWNIVYINNIA